MNPNFYLDTKLNRKGQAQIFLYLTIGGKRFKMATGNKIEPMKNKEPSLLSMAALSLTLG